RGGNPRASREGRGQPHRRGSQEGGVDAVGREPSTVSRPLVLSVSLLDIIRPVMVGPRSSHTARARRLRSLARHLPGGTPERAHVELHGSFARTGEGHGTDKAIVGGLLGFRTDDDRIRTALDIAERDGLKYAFEKTKLGQENEVHPNTVRITVERGDRKHVMLGSSLG